MRRGFSPSVLWALGHMPLSRDTGDSVLEQRNSDYWGQQPAVKQLLWTWSTEPVLMNMSVLAKYADIVNPLPPIFAQALSTNRRVRLIEGQETAMFWVALNMRDESTCRSSCAQGVELCNRPRCAGTHAVAWFGSPANSPLSPAEFGYDANTRGYPYNAARAKRAAEAGRLWQRVDAQK